jgi:hypothetical protein
MDVADLRDSFIDARAEVAGIMEEAVEEFYRPDKMLQLAVMVTASTPEEWAMLPPDVRAQIEEVLNG